MLFFFFSPCKTKTIWTFGESGHWNMKLCRKSEIRACCQPVLCHCIRQRGERPDWHPWRCKLRDSAIGFTPQLTSCRYPQKKGNMKCDIIQPAASRSSGKRSRKSFRSLVNLLSKKIENIVQNLNVTESFTVFTFALGIIEFRASCNKCFKLDLMGEQAFVNQQRLSEVLTFVGGRSRGTGAGSGVGGRTLFASQTWNPLYS